MRQNSRNLFNQSSIIIISLWLICDNLLHITLHLSHCCWCLSVYFNFSCLEIMFTLRKVSKFSSIGFVNECGCMHEPSYHYVRNQLDFIRTFIRTPSTSFFLCTSKFKRKTNNFNARFDDIWLYFMFYYAVLLSINRLELKLSNCDLS